MRLDTAVLVGLPALVCLSLAWAIVSALRFLAPRWGLLDIPNSRSSHLVPTPRAGGLGFVFSILVVSLTAPLWNHFALIQGEATLLLGGVIVASAGLADDRWGLSARLRLGCHLTAAAILVVGVGPVRELQWPGWPAMALGWVSIPFTLLWIVGMTNAYNFMDGIDGLAGAQAVVAAGAAAILAYGRGDMPVALLAAILSAGVAGFLLHNWPPARIFMGDVGSAFLGYLFAGLAVLSGTGAINTFSFAFWLILLAPILFDTSLTLVSRAARGERWYEAHRQHLYQRLIGQGWSHLQVTTLYLCAGLLMVIAAAANIMLGVAGAALAAAALGPLVGILILVKWGDRRGMRNPDRSLPPR